VLIEIFAIHNVHVFLQDHESDVQLLPSPLFGNVDLLMDLLCAYNHCILVNLQQDYLTYSLNA
jgi:hypothetical protein